VYLSSGDAGNSFVHVQGFPFEGDNKLSKFQRLKHRIKVVAFDDKGHFAFLTNQREVLNKITCYLLEIS
jgi:hypothetical protein